MERRRFDVLADDDAIVRRDALAGTSICLKCVA
jgi:hypothetical protein